MKNFKFILLFVAICLVTTGCSLSQKSDEEVLANDNKAQLAQCLTDNGAKFYGAFWCPHCVDQKDMFGKDAKAFVPYYECDPRGENPVPETCKKEAIKGYPTWVFSDGTRRSGAQSLDVLADLAGCEFAN
jgi:thiol-disulfide isomerase/thioredoxin